jgi:PTH1 family peptidyl-tRNA hydrolase
MRLVVGLGNPGREYVGTRHNIGYEVVDALAIKLGWVKSVDEFNRFAKVKFEALTFDGTLSSGEKLLLLMPMTYMNLSGRSVQAAASFYQVPPTDLMIVLDDIALPCGRIRLRASGSSGGHNGLKDIQRALGTDEYPRLRVGIDAPPARVSQHDYVRGRFSPDQRAALEPAYDRASSAVVLWLEQGITTAMNQFNAADDKKEQKDSKD